MCAFSSSTLMRPRYWACRWPSPSSRATHHSSYLFSPMSARLPPGAGLIHFHRSNLMFPDLISHAPDFEHQLGACVNAMSQDDAIGQILRSEEHTSELQSLMRISYAVFCLKKKTTNNKQPR